MGFERAAYDSIKWEYRKRLWQYLRWSLVYVVFIVVSTVGGGLLAGWLGQQGYSYIAVMPAFVGIAVALAVSARILLTKLLPLGAEMRAVRNTMSVFPK